MKNQALFSLTDKSKKLKCRLLQFLFAALRINISLKFQIFISEICHCFFVEIMREAFVCEKMRAKAPLIFATRISVYLFIKS